MQGLLKNPLKVGTGRTTISANLIQVGKDFLVVLSGEGQHIGGCSLAEPYLSKGSESANVSSISCKGHQDIELTRLIAQKVSKRLKVVVIAVGGIHIENATKEEINQLLENAQKLGDHLANSFATVSKLEEFDAPL